MVKTDLQRRIETLEAKVIPPPPIRTPRLICVLPEQTLAEATRLAYGGRRPVPYGLNDPTDIVVQIIESPPRTDGSKGSA